jgi:uncharacterized protein YukE
MGNEISVNTGGLKNAVSGMGQVAEQFVNILSELSDALGGLGAPWGNDPSGQAFAKNYDGPNQEVRNGIGDTGTVVHSTGVGVETWAAGLDITDAANTALANGLGSDSGNTGSSPADYPAD